MLVVGIGDFSTALDFNLNVKVAFPCVPIVNIVKFLEQGWVPFAPSLEGYEPLVGRGVRGKRLGVGTAAMESKIGLMEDLLKISKESSVRSVHTLRF